MTNLIRAAKASDYFSVIVFTLMLLLIKHYINLTSADYIAITGIYVLLHLHVLSARSNNKRFKAIEKQEKENNERYINNQRMKVLDKIGICNTHSCLNSFRLTQLIDTYGHEMGEEQLANLENLAPEMESQVNVINELSDLYADLSNEISLNQINQDYAQLLNSEADASSTSKIIEIGFKSYEQNSG